MKPVIIIPCVAHKKEVACPAKDMYDSQYFTACRDYAERYSSRWHIMSAKHGILEPNKVIEPYDMSLSSFTSPQLAEWARGAFLQFVQIYPMYNFRLNHNFYVVIVGGQLYRKILVPLLRGYGYRVDVPFDGLGIGEQISAMRMLAKLGD